MLRNKIIRLGGNKKKYYSYNKVRLFQLYMYNTMTSMKPEN